MNIEQDLRASPPQSQVELWRQLQRILAEWRKAERRLGIAQPGSADHAQAAAEVKRSRAEYQRLFALHYPPPSEG